MALQLPLHLLDDQPFRQPISSEIPTYHDAHPFGDERQPLGRSQEAGKGHNHAAVLALAAKHRASFWALESDSRATLGHPVQRLCWHGRMLTTLLPALDTEVAEGAAL